MDWPMLIVAFLWGVPIVLVLSLVFGYAADWFLDLYEEWE
jgi:hypothetical protein